MRLSKNFTLFELTYSDTASKLGFKNLPTQEEIRNLGALAQNVLQPLRDMLGKPITITSGFRNKLLNQKVRGASNSQHLYGQAADIIVLGMEVEDLYNYIKNSNLIYDQLILEQTKKDKWVHISYNKKFNRRQNLIYKNNKYTKD